MRSRLTLTIIAVLLWFVGSCYWYLHVVKGFWDRQPVVLTPPPVVPLPPPPEPPPAPPVEPPPIPAFVAPPGVSYTPLFAFGVASCPVEGDLLTQLDAVVDYLKKNEKVQVKLVGYTCDLGADDYNLKLGQGRADFIKSELEKRGIPATQILTESRGKADPVSTEPTIAGRTKNRRVQFSFIQP